jgi:hypothetical protein
MLDTWGADPDQEDRRCHADSITYAFGKAYRKAGVTNARFMTYYICSYVLHLLPELGKLGIDFFRIMAITGHKTMAVFVRYIK